MYFQCPKKFDSWSKNVISGQFSVHFRWKFRRKKLLWSIFIEPKGSFLNFMEILLSYFWAIVLISAVISILDDFGSRVTALFFYAKHDDLKIFGYSSSVWIGTKWWLSAWYFTVRDCTSPLKANYRWQSVTVVSRGYKNLITGAI